MERVLRVLVVLAGLMSTGVLGGRCFGQVVHDAEHGFELTLRDGWVEIPDDVLQEVMGAAQNPDAQRPLIYAAGYQIEGDDGWFVYPYVLVQVIPYSGMGMTRQISEDEFVEVVKAVTGADIDQAMDDALSSETRELLTDIDVQRPVLEKDRRRFTWGLTMDVAGIGLVRGYSVSNFGREALVQVSFYAMSDDWEKYTAERNSMTESFAFDAAHAYSESVGAGGKGNSTSILGSVLWWVAAGAVIVAVVYLLGKRKGSEGRSQGEG